MLFFRNFGILLLPVAAEVVLRIKFECHCCYYVGYCEQVVVPHGCSDYRNQKWVAPKNADWQEFVNLVTMMMKKYFVTKREHDELALLELEKPIQLI